MGRKYYLDPESGEKIYIRDKVPSLGAYRKSADQDVIDEELNESLSDIADEEELVFSSSVDGYINAAGNFVSTTGYKMYAPFTLGRNHTVTVKSKGYYNGGSVVTVISSYDGTNYTPLVGSVSSKTETYTYTATEEMQIVICCDNVATPSGDSKIFSKTLEQNKAEDSEFQTIKSDIESAEEIVQISAESYTDAYIDYNTGKVIKSSGYRITQPIAVKAGMNISVTSKGYVSSSFNVTIIAKVNSDNSYTPLVGSESTKKQIYEYFVTEDMSIVIGYDNALTPTGTVSRTISNVYDLIELNKRSSDDDMSLTNYEIDQADRRILNAEKHNDFAWSEFDKPYFVFVHDDTNQYLETYYSVFNSASVPMSAATIPNAVTDTHKATLQTMEDNGGEVLLHYDGSIYQTSTDAEWLAITRDGKRSLEAMGFTIRGIIRAGDTTQSSGKGEKYCRRYFDYANDKMGISTQYDLPRKLMLTFADLSAFKAQLDADALINGIHAYGFHGGRDDEAWITTDAMSEIIAYIKAKGNCEFTTYSALFDEFGSTELEQRIVALENK